MKQLAKFLEKVYKSNDFYSKRIKEYGITNPIDITQYPVLTRKQLQENRYDMFSFGYQSKYFSQKLRRQSSSGSSGVPVNVYWDDKDYYASNLSLWRKRFQYYGIRPFDRYILFTLNASNVQSDGEKIYTINKPSNVLQINITLIQKEESYIQLVGIINEFEPNWLYIQPSILAKLMQTYKRNDLTIPATLKYIESVGEILSSDLQNKAADFFNVPVANMYGSEEMNGIAYECPYHHMHVLSDNVLVECEDSSGIKENGEGEAIITNLHNLAMPLIRYNQGDQIVLEKLPTLCMCGDSSPIVKLIKGRSHNSIIMNGIMINSFLLTEIMAEVNNQINDMITDYNFIYKKSINKLICEIRLQEKNKNWYGSIKKFIDTIFYQKTVLVESLSFEVIPMVEESRPKGKYQVLEIME